jgi:hypothetical protein
VHLDIGQNGITDLGFESLFGALAENGSLVSLYLGNSQEVKNRNKMS